MTVDAWKLLDAQGWLDHRGMPLGREFFDITPDDDDGPSALTGNAGPLLIYHAIHDTEVPIEHARMYVISYERIKATVRLVEIDAPDHGMRSVTANETIINGSVEWFARYLNSGKVNS
jgi:hypothetical protein